VRVGSRAHQHAAGIWPAFAFGVEEALVASELYRRLRARRRREIDLAIAACAIVQGAALWTRIHRTFATSQV
jgi:predicted nucleic acid-binding protein